MALAHYTFLPWLRRGIANAVVLPATAKSRADIAASVTLSDGATDLAPPIDKSFELAGPGDVVGFDANVVVRTEPRAGTADFEPNYLPFIEFYDEDFCTRHTPAPPSDHRLAPWLSLLVLAEGEYERNFSASRPLTSVRIISPDPASFFPPEGQIWAWSHVQIAVSIAGGSTPDAGHLADTLARAPDAGVSRLVSPRRLTADTFYRAFVVPTFEVGRKAGLGIPVNDAAESGTVVSWRGDPEFPVYYEWSFRTGVGGDFEDLVQRIVPRAVDEKVGVRDMDIAAAGFGMPQVATTATNVAARVVGLEGALKAPTMKPKPVGAVGAVSAFPTEAAKVVNAPAIAKASGATDPLVAPPLMGGWHALMDQVDPGGMPGWVNELNLDPRERAAGGLGARVVRANEERYLRLAWEQIGEVNAANRKAAWLRFAQASQHKSFVKNVAPLSQGGALALSAPVMARVLGSPKTIRALLHESRLPDAALSSAFRKLTRPRGPIVRRALAAGQRHGAVDKLATALNSGRASAAPKPPPINGPTLDQISDAVARLHQTSTGFARWSLWLVLLLAIAAIAAFLLLPGGLGLALGGALATAAVGAVVAELRTRPTITSIARTRLARLTPRSVARMRPTRFALTSPGQVATAHNAAEAADFAVALQDFAALVAARPAPAPARPAFGMAQAHAKMMGAIAPANAYPRRAAATIRVGERSLTDYARATYANELNSTAPPSISPVMAYPDIKEPMYRPLSQISEDLLVPNLGLIPPNTISLMLTNPPFIEAYMAGVNHAFAGELLWREYPTDCRGSPFRQFWDVSAVISPVTDPVARAETLKDIRPLHEWRPTSTELGQHPNPGRSGEQIVLVLRGDLLRRYPNTIIYAQRARWSTDAQHPNELALFDEEGVLALAHAENPNISYPIFTAQVAPDLAFVGFKLDLEEARGDLALDETPEARANIPASKLGWFFVLQEAVAEPRMGLDEHAPPPEMKSPVMWDNFSWDNLDMTGRTLIDLAAPFTTPFGAQTPVPLNWAPDDDATSADVASILYQKPVLVAWHARQMLERGKVGQ